MRHGSTRYSPPATDNPKFVERKGNTTKPKKVIQYEPPDKGPSTLLTAQNKNSL